MDQVIRIQPEVITGFRLDGQRPAAVGTSTGQAEG
jgi:hypothetical protein